MTEMIFFWLALGCYVISSVTYIVALTFARERARGLGQVFAVAGLVLHAVSMVIRWRIVGHGPYLNTYEILSSTAWTAVVLFILLQWREKGFANLGAAIMPIAFILMGFALIGSTEAKNIPPTLRSIWLVVHVIFAKLTIAALLVATGIAILYLMKKHMSEDSAMLKRLPSLAVLDDYGYRLVAFGFIVITIMIITGAIWANNAWGSYWTWEPAQTWSLVLWLVYGIYLHGRVTFRWSGEVAAWYIVFAFVFSIATFFVMPYYIKGLHAKYMVG